MQCVMSCDHVIEVKVFGYSWLWWLRKIKSTMLKILRESSELFLEIFLKKEKSTKIIQGFFKKTNQGWKKKNCCIERLKVWTFFTVDIFFILQFLKWVLLLNVQYNFFYFNIYNFPKSGQGRVVLTNWWSNTVCYTSNTDTEKLRYKFHKSLVEPIWNLY